MLLRVFEEEHEEQVNHCQFTNTTRRLLLATCSNDKMLNVKVRETNIPLPTPQCALSGFISAPVSLPFFIRLNSFLQLWNLNKPTSQNTMFGHFEPVNHCCFSPDDTYVSTSSNDGTLKVTAIKLDTCKAFLS